MEERTKGRVWGRTGEASSPLRKAIGGPVYRLSFLKNNQNRLPSGNHSCLDLISYLAKIWSWESSSILMCSLLC